LAWIRKGDYRQAIADYGEAIRLDPSIAKCYGDRGWAWLELEEPDKAIADLDEAIRLNPQDDRAFLSRGVAWSEKREFGKALSDYDEAIRLAPNTAKAYENAALIRASCTDARHRDGKRAVELATRACELSEWSSAESCCILAAAYAQAGNFDSAIEYQDKAITLNSDDSDFVEFAKQLRSQYKARQPYRED
jgi:tetratricopeptide (TPR) repeat protein